ncbi:sugar porter family MFS transporter [Peribacillus frigoritolerans]|uniref:sugar porter family MFS transporter n=1 Tax=Peribacillus frigoritolerans TaxID=450367 RepID=UPI0007BEC9DA|nr:sugar porter family MFS transporter [Peribacillus frigoritolerans]MED3708648.1 sugar porter family MFS transporter [Peribacillus frigoritolerans]MED3890857.1 sugar porter family MFS transporter [Peribacillus frigoritolerans]MED4633593.1 sugar porter family MFS transporter [Peribacillus frigoritolerans]ULM95055.1 sugar porter family MFS transporter [Peribacillus frigoritolerans]CAH0256136.1 putative metabolite transport protein CsbC [Peribacillus frigoritolerans]
MVNEKKISSGFIYFFGAFGGILFGYDIGVMTGALPFLQHDWNLQNNPGAIGWITSSLMFGAIFGGAMAGQLSDRLGRRKMILISSIIFAVGSILAGISPHNGILFMIVARILLGLAVGAASALVPAYMSEMAPARLRGRLSGINQTMIVSGMLLSYIVAYLLKDLPGTMAWRLMLSLAAVPALILFIGVSRLPESPRFLIKNNKMDEARRVLGYIRADKEQIDSEITQIQETVKEEEKVNQKASWGTLLSNKYRYLVMAGVGVAAFQQFQGANAIFYYIPMIVEKATGHEASSVLMWPIIQGVILVLGSLIFLMIADKFNRRTLLTIGGTIMGLSFILPAILNVLIPNANPMMMVVFLSIYVALYSFTWAPLTWVIVGEIFPLVIRGRASGVASSFNWIGSFLVGLLFPIMTASMSQEAVFSIFGAICLLGVLFIRTCVPETRGHTLEEIEKIGESRQAKGKSA